VKTTASIAMGLVLLWSATASAQDPPQCDTRPDVLLADLGLHVINAGYQRTLGCGIVVQASAGLYSPWMVNNDVFGLGGGVEREVIGAVLRARPFFFPLAAAPAGLWVSPFVQAGLVSAGDQTGIAIAGGAAIGWTWWLGSRVLLGIGLGAQWHAVIVDGSTKVPGFTRLGPHGDINLGYAL
jgi:hypothetical protein